MTGEIRCMSRKGDVKLSWEPGNEVEIAAAREMFDKYVNKEKWSAFREKMIDSKGDKIKWFDPDAARIVLVPPITGG
jgi:hypothetical protein